MAGSLFFELSATKGKVLVLTSKEEEEMARNGP